MPAVLHGVRVVELGSMLAASFSAHILAQLGAEVIKVEPPAGDPTRTIFRGGAGGSFIAYNRGKRSVCIDLKSAEGRDALDKILATADVLLHNLAPGSLADLRVTFEDYMKVRPDGVYCHVRGYGPGPNEDRIASNPVIEAATGVMHANRVGGRPTRLGPSYHDQFAGSYAVIGILAALRMPPGPARRVEVGLYETGLHVAARELTQAQLREKFGSKSPVGAEGGEFSLPGYGSYETGDGRWVHLLMLTDNHWKKFCTALDVPDDVATTFANVRERKKRRAEVEEIFRSTMRAGSFAELTARLDAAGVGWTEVVATEDVLSDPQARAPGKIRRVDFDRFDFEVPSLPLPFQIPEVDGELPPPRLGQHTAEVLGSVGYGAQQIEALERTGAVVTRSEIGTNWAPPRA